MSSNPLNTHKNAPNKDYQAAGDAFFRNVMNKKLMDLAWGHLPKSHPEKMFIGLCQVAGSRDGMKKAAKEMGIDWPPEPDQTERLGLWTNVQWVRELKARMIPKLVLWQRDMERREREAAWR